MLPIDSCVCEIYLTIEMFSGMTFSMVQLCPFSIHTQISHTHTHVMLPSGTTRPWRWRP